MKNVIRKSEEERKEEAKNTVTEILVKDTYYFYWACDRCNVAFFDGDTILESTDGYRRCPLKRGFFGRTCLNQIYGGDEDCFNRYYKLK